MPDVPGRWLRVPATWYVEVIRNTPLLVQLFFIYFGFSQINIDVPNYMAGARSGSW